jgi:hypothetical protein
MINFNKVEFSDAISEKSTNLGSMIFTTLA